MVPEILNARDEEFFRKTRAVPEREENHAKIVEALMPIVCGIKDGGYVYGKEIQYADFIVGSIMVWILQTKEEDFEKIIKWADIQDWRKDISRYM